MAPNSNTAKKEEAIRLGEAACKFYVDWYDHGESYTAGGMAYDLVSYIRQMLAALKDDSPPATGGSS